MAAEFRLLGAVEAVGPGGRVDLGPARQRCVLVALLVDANRVVPRERLVDRVWGGRAPLRVDTAVRSYVSRLRAATLGIDGFTIEHRHGGYTAAVADHVVDLHRFHGLVRQAHATRDDRAASALLGRALDSWRGEPFAGLRTGWLDELRDQLERDRLGVQLDHAERQLRLGEHASVLATLAGLAEAHPLDERVAELHLRALHRSGRQADALRHYERLRRTLATELGASPGAALQELHLRMLTDAPRRPTPPTPSPIPSTPVPASAASPVVPRQLPAAPHPFVGRADELRAISARLLAEPTPGRPGPVCVIGAAGGAGKTWLGLRWAHDHAARFPDGQLFVNLRGFEPLGEPTEPGTALRGFLDALGVPPADIPADLDAQAGLFRSITARRRVLIVLDNARDSAAVQPLLPGGHRSAVLVTSRIRLTKLATAHDAALIDLGTLTAPESRQLITHQVGAPRAAAEPAVVAELVHRCAGLPLALAVVAARANAHPEFPLAAIAGELREGAPGLDAFADPDDGNDLRAVLSWSHRALDAPAADLFTLLGLVPGPDVGLPAVASLAGSPPSRCRVLLRTLEAAHLVRQPEPDRYRMHDLIRRYATEQAAALDGETRVAATRRLFDHHLHTAHRAARLLKPHRQPVGLAPAADGVVVTPIADAGRAMAWMALERANLLAAAQHAPAAGLPAHAWQLLWTMVDFVERSGHWTEFLAAHRAALAAEPPLEPVGQARLHRQLSRAYLGLKSHDLAIRHGLVAATLYRQLDDPIALAHAHMGIGASLVQQQRFGEALHHTEQAHEIFVREGHRTGEAHALNGLAWCRGQLGEHRAALDLVERAHAMQVALGDEDAQAACLDTAGTLHHRLGDHELARRSFVRSLEVNERTHNHEQRAETLIHFAETLRALGDSAAAVECLRAAVALLDRLRSPDLVDARALLAEYQDA